MSTFVRLASAALLLCTDARADTWYAVPNPTGGAHACTFADPCSLVAAITAATPPNAIVELASGTYLLGNSTLDLDKSLSIEGTGTDTVLSQANAICAVNIGIFANPQIALRRLAISGGGPGICLKSPAVGNLSSLDADEITMTMSQGNGLAITLGNATVKHSLVTSNTFAGIFVSSPGQSALTLTDSEVSHNTARGIEYNGTGSLSIDRSLIASNSGGYGGGLKILADIPVSITNTTFASNSGSQGGGLALNNNGTYVMTLKNVTFTANTSGLGSALALLVSARLSLTNTLIDGSCSNDASTQVQSTYSLESTGNTCGLSGTGDQVNVSAAALKLSSLADNGGRTQTALPQTGSVAIDAGSACEPVDQRDLVRNVGACDIGAAEAGATLFDEIFYGSFD